MATTDRYSDGSERRYQEKNSENLIGAIAEYEAGLERDPTSDLVPALRATIRRMREELTLRDQECDLAEVPVRPPICYAE